MIDKDSMIVSLRLAWLKRLPTFCEIVGIWNLEKPPSTFWNASVVYSILPDLKDYPKLSQFYYNFLSWWTYFQIYIFDSELNWCHIIWNNKVICIENKHV